MEQLPLAAPPKENSLKKEVVAPAKPKRKARKKSPTARTLEACRKRGWMAYVVEKRIPKINILKDAFGFGDVLVVETGMLGATLIQATSDNGGNMAKRIQKIMGECYEEALTWLVAENRIRVWAWGQRGPAGKRKLWVLREHEITISELYDAKRKRDRDEQRESNSGSAE